MATQVEIHHPNRESAAAKGTRVAVIVLLLISAAIMLVVVIGGWDAIEGAKPVTFAFALVYLVIAFFVVQWHRGVLPLAAALGTLLAIFAAVAGPGWFDRNQVGFTEPAISENVLGLLTLLLVPIQVLLIAFAAQGFLQAWNVEVEVPLGGPRAPGDSASPPGPAATTA